MLPRGIGTGKLEGLNPLCGRVGITKLLEEGGTTLTIKTGKYKET